MAQLMSIKRNLEVCPGNVNVPAIFHVSQGDKGTRIILGLVNNGQDYTIPESTTATIRGSRPDGTLFTEFAAEVETTEIKFNLPEEMTTVPGPVLCEAVMVNGSANTTATTNFILDVEPSPTNLGSLIPGTDAGVTWLRNKLREEFIQYRYVSRMTSKSFTLSEDASCVFFMTANTSSYFYEVAVWRMIGYNNTVLYKFNGTEKPSWLTVTATAEGITFTISNASTSKDLRMGIVVFNGTVTPVDDPVAES